MKGVFKAVPQRSELPVDHQRIPGGGAVLEVATRMPAVVSEAPGSLRFMTDNSRP